MNGMLSDSDNLTLRAWRRGELGEAEAQAFETRLFFEPTLLEAAYLDQALEAGLRQQDVQRPPAPPRTGRSRRQPPWAMLLAAGLGAAAVLPFIEQDGDSPGWSGNVEWVSVDVRRGAAAAEPLLVAPRASTELVAMELPAPGAADAPLTVRLLGAEHGDTVFELAGLQPVDGIVSLAFPREALAAGDYRIEFRSTADGSALASPVLSFRYRPR